MRRATSGRARGPRADRFRRTVIWAFIIAVPWAPGAVALAMLLTGHAG